MLCLRYWPWLYVLSCLWRKIVSYVLLRDLILHKRSCFYLIYNIIVIFCSLWWRPQNFFQKKVNLNIHFWKEDLIWTNILFTTSRMQKAFASGLNLKKVQLSSFSMRFCRSTSYTMSLSQWSNLSHSIANLYFGKYRSIPYFPAPNWGIISSPLKACMICLRVSCSLHNHLFLWSSIPRHFAKFIKLGIGFLHLLITYKRPCLQKKISHSFFWALGTGLIAFLADISHSSNEQIENLGRVKCDENSLNLLYSLCLGTFQRGPVWTKYFCQHQQSFQFHLKNHWTTAKTSFLILVSQEKFVSRHQTQN